MWFLLFSRSVPSLNIWIYVYYVIGVFVVCVCFVLCRKKKKERRESSLNNHGKGEKDEISVLSLLSSYLR